MRSNDGRTLDVGFQHSNITDETEKEMNYTGRQIFIVLICENPHTLRWSHPMQAASDSACVTELAMRYIVCKQNCPYLMKDSTYHPMHVV